MVKLTVLYGTPVGKSEEEFLSHYEGTHVPIVHKMEKVQEFTWGTTVAGPDGAEPPFTLVAELRFASHEDMQAAFASEAGRAAVADLPNLQTEPFHMVVSELR